MKYTKRNYIERIAQAKALFSTDKANGTFDKVDDFSARYLKPFGLGIYKKQLYIKLFSDEITIDQFRQLAFGKKHNEQLELAMATTTSASTQCNDDTIRITLTFTRKELLSTPIDQLARIALLKIVNEIPSTLN